MKKLIFLFAIIFCAKVEAQQIAIDTIINARVFSSNFIPVNVFGKMRNGHIYTCGLKNNYLPNGSVQTMQFIKIDLTSKTVSYKTLEGIPSSPSALWFQFFDSSGALYLSLIFHDRIVLRFDLKDSIVYKNMGNVFKDGHSTAYSASLGHNKHVYFGGSSGDPYVSEYNPVIGKMTKYPSMDAANDFVLSIAGDERYIYAQTGQRNSIQLWAMKKADSTKKLLFKIPNNTRMNLINAVDGIYVSFHTDTLKGMWKLVDGKAFSFNGNEKPVYYEEVPPEVKSHYDQVQNKLFYTLNGTSYDNIPLNTGVLRNIIRSVFGFKNDAGHLYLAADYYGNYYEYDLKKDATALLGNTTFNIYSVLEDSDSTIYFGNYPSGALLKWNRNLPWTLNKFINGKVIAPSRASNPRLIGYFKSETPAGFHHLQEIKRDFKGNIVCAGNVIRIGNTCSIGVYDPKKDVMYGYDFSKVKALATSGLAAWKNLMIFSTSNPYGAAKLYYYNSISNTMVDSLDLGFDDYGKINIAGNTLTGIAGDRIYKLDLFSKKIILNYAFPKNSILYSQMLSNGTIMIKTQNSLPDGFAKFIKLPYSGYYEVGKDVYAVRNSSTILVRLKNIIQ